MRLRHTIAALAVLAACSEGGAPAGGNARAPADSAAGEVPFDYAGPNQTAVVVPVRINGTGPYQLVLDTGATFTCVDVGIRDRLALPARRGFVGVGVGVGQAGRMGLVRIDTLQVGAARVTDTSACVLNLSQFRDLGVPVVGLLGLSFLKEFRVSLDFRRKVLTLTKPAGDG